VDLNQEKKVIYHQLTSSSGMGGAAIIALC
jgi:hypothetical protein